MDTPDRRLVAIVCADVAGYSRLMSADEEGTFARLQHVMDEVIAPSAQLHRGRIIKTMGDGFLAEFASAVKAVEFASDVQKMCSASDDRLCFRIGIHVGDVITKDGDVFGDGVNLAARLQEAADVGGILVSRAVRDHAREHFPFEEAGEKRLKNISRPIRTFRVAGGRRSSGLRNKPQGQNWPWTTVAILACLAIVVLGGFVAPRFLGDTSSVAVQQSKPAVAVLPFANLSGDPAQEYFSDGMTEDILTALSKFPELVVIASNSSFHFKGEPLDLSKVSTELGVGWVVSGSIRRDAERVRVTAQLIDTSTGAQRWSERYDRDLKSVFALQDEITEKIVTSLVARITKAEVERTLRKPPSTWEAHDFYLRAVDKFRVANEGRKAEDFLELRHLVEAGLARDPNYAPLYAVSASADIPIYREPVLPDEWRKPETLDKVYQNALKAVQLDPLLPEAHAVHGTALFLRGRTPDALMAYERAVALNPNLALGIYADVLAYDGQGAKAVEIAKRAMRLDPFFPGNYLFYFAHAQIVSRRYDEALEALHECDRRIEFRPCDVFLAALYAHRGDSAQAHRYKAEILRQEPHFTIGSSGARIARQYSRKEDHDFLIEGLRKAGLPQ